MLSQCKVFKNNKPTYIKNVGRAIRFAQYNNNRNTVIK